MSSWTYPEFCASTGSGRSCFSPLAIYSRDTRMVEDDDVLGQVVKLLFIRCLRSSFTNVHVCHSVLVVSSLVLVRCVCMSIRHLFLIPGIPKHISLQIFPLQLFFSLSLALSRRLCLCVHSSLPFLSRISRSTCVVVWFERSSMRYQRCTTGTTSRMFVSLDVCRQHVESSWLNLWNYSNWNP